MRFRKGDKVRKFEGMTNTATVLDYRDNGYLPEPYYLIQYDGFDELEPMWVREYQITDADRSSPRYMEDAYAYHKRQEVWDDEEGWQPHPDGCYWCGSFSHASDMCSEREDFYEPYTHAELEDAEEDALIMTDEEWAQYEHDSQYDEMKYDY